MVAKPLSTEMITVYTSDNVHLCLLLFFSIHILVIGLMMIKDI